jgi:lactoylglutathione lyase
MSERVHEMRVVVTAEDYDEALRFYRDALGLHEHAEFVSGGGGRVTIFDAGRATLELADPLQADYIDEVEVGRRVAGHVRIASGSTTAQPSRLSSRQPARRSSPSRLARRGARSTPDSRRRLGCS